MSVFNDSIALGAASAIGAQANAVMFTGINAGLTANDLSWVVGITKGLSRWRPVRYFLSRRYRSVALSPRDPENNDWDWR